MDLKAAIDAAEKFIDEKKLSAASREEESAVIPAVGGFAEDLRINSQRGRPVFWFRDVYIELKRKLDESPPRFSPTG